MFTFLALLYQDAPFLLFSPTIPVINFSFSSSKQNPVKLLQINGEFFK